MILGQLFRTGCSAHVFLTIFNGISLVSWLCCTAWRPPARLAVNLEVLSSTNAITRAFTDSPLDFAVLSHINWGQFDGLPNCLPDCEKTPSQNHKL